MMNNKVIDSFFKCKYKAYLVNKNETGESSEFDILEEELYILNKETFFHVIQGAPNTKLFPKPNLIKKNLINNKGYVVNQIFQNNAIEIDIDAIELTRVKSSPKDISYIPISISSKERISRSDKISFVIKVLIVSEFQSITFQAGKIIYGQKLNVAKVNFKTYEKEARKNLIILRKAIENEEPPRFYLNPHCQVCPYHKLCKAILIDKDDLSLLARMGEKDILKKNNRGGSCKILVGTQSNFQSASCRCERELLACFV